MCHGFKPGQRLSGAELLLPKMATESHPRPKNHHCHQNHCHQNHFHHNFFHHCHHHQRWRLRTLFVLTIFKNLQQVVELGDIGDDGELVRDVTVHHVLNIEMKIKTKTTKMVPPKSERDI